MENNKYSYPPHLSDPLRRKIAQQYIQHELRKLFPTLQNGEAWKLIDNDIENWFSGNLLMTPVRGFWNGFYAIARGFRFKNLLPLVTSMNINWEKKCVRPEDLQFGATFEGLDFLGPNPSAANVKNILNLPGHRAKKEKLLGILKQKGSLGVYRDQDLVIIHAFGGGQRVIDGNRRVFLSLFGEDREIYAYVGTPTADPEIFEQWVPAAFLQDLLALHSRDNTPAREELTNVIAFTVANALKDSTSGRLEWRAICYLAHNPLDKLLNQTVAQILLKS